MDPTSVKGYYDRITAAEIGAVARRLIEDRLTAEHGHTLRFDCPHHASQSKASLIVDTERQAFWCKGCDVGGDVLHFVEFVQSGRVTSHHKGPMPESHRQARDTLASLVGLPPLAEFGLSPEDQQKAEARRQEADLVFAVLTDAAEFYQRKLLANADALKWLGEHYAIGRETFERLKIGFADNAGLVDGYLVGQKGHSREVIDRTGLYVRGKDGQFYPFFRSRVIFPYWKQGRVVYLIGRKTPWTPDKEHERAKYKKLPVRSVGKPYISEAIQNDVFYGEDALATVREEVVITEGVTDCIALAERGVPCISPVTVTFRDEDHEKLLSLVRHVKRVYICQDNEVSGVGLAGALKTARFLCRAGVDVRLVELPLGEKHRAAREALAAKGIPQDATPEEIQQAKATLDDAGKADVDRLLCDAKIDLNEYLLAATADDFRKLMAEALPPVHWQIKRLDPSPPDVRARNEALKPVLRAIAELDPLAQDECIALVQSHYGGSRNLPKKVLEESVKEFARQARQSTPRPGPPSAAPPDSCQYLINRLAFETSEAEGAPDWNRIAEAAYDWFAAHGASFFHDRHGRVFVCFEDEIYEMTPSPATHRSYLAMMFKHTGLNCMTPSGRVFFETLANLAFNRGLRKETFNWSHTCPGAYTVYFNLNNDENQIVKVSADGVEVMSNGSNADGVMLASSTKMRPVRYLPDAALDEADRRVAQLLCDNLTCADNEKLLIVYWLSAFLLMDFAGTKPMLRFEGPKESGKSTASKLISTLLYGDPQQKRSTTAANYADGAVNPLVLLDNIETKNATDHLIDFMLTAVTGIGNEKRKRGTDSETVIEFAKCLINTSGIEPLGGEFSELISRTLIVEFDIHNSRQDYFLEAEVLDRIRSSRDLILSALLVKAHRALRLMRDGAQGRVMGLLAKTLEKHSKQRANDYLALMYLMMIAGEGEAKVEQSLGELDPLFVEMMATQQEAATDVQVGSNPLVALLKGLFQEHAVAVGADQKTFISTGLSQVERLKLAYHLTFDDASTLSGVRANELHLALSLFAKNKGLLYPYVSPKQLGRRLVNDIDTLREAGLDITFYKGHAGILVYGIRLAEPSDE